VGAALLAAAALWILSASLDPELDRATQTASRTASASPANAAQERHTPRRPITSERRASRSRAVPSETSSHEHNKRADAPRGHDAANPLPKSQANPQRPRPLTPRPRPSPQKTDDETDDEPDDDDGAREHTLTDRSGRGGSLGDQLNREFMPLAAECIEMARERTPELAGLLSIGVNLVPVDSARVIIESVDLQADNEISDTALIECIEQTTLSIEGLETTESFAISMPIGPED
jgi:hypothetical protein